jgi:hypothetical protein
MTTVFFHISSLPPPLSTTVLFFNNSSLILTIRFKMNNSNFKYTYKQERAVRTPAFLLSAHDAAPRASSSACCRNPNHCPRRRRCRRQPHQSPCLLIPESIPPGPAVSLIAPCPNPSRSAAPASPQGVRPLRQ